MKKSVRMILALSLLTALFVPVSAALAAPDKPVVEPLPGTLVDVAVATPNFSTLVQAVVAADLVDVLDGPGKYTVFAPTNEAFARTLSELGISASDLLKDKELLTSILLYHVVPGEVTSSQVLGLRTVRMADGNTARISVRGGDVYINGARVQTVDIRTSNGVIHAIDQVLLPPAAITSNRSANYGDSIVGVAAATPQFSILVEAVVAAGLADTLASGGPYTVFAPSNAAFAAALSSLGVTKEQLFADKELLTSILLYHVASGRVFAQDAAGLSSATMLDGNTVTISRDFFGLQINGARVIRADINTGNGVIHAIDTVLLPPAN